RTSPHEDLGDAVGARELGDAARYVLTFYYVRLDTQVTREAHVALDGFADALGRGYVNRQTIGAEVVRHALAAADEVGRGRAAGEADEDALIAPRRHQPLFDLVGGVADGELAERGEVGLGEEVVERAAGLLGGVDHAALDAIAQGLGREITWLGSGHTLPWYHEPATFPLSGGNEAVLLLAEPGALIGPEVPDLDRFTVSSEPVRWLWIIPVSAPERALATERGPASLVTQLAAQRRSWVAG